MKIIIFFKNYYFFCYNIYVQIRGVLKNMKKLYEYIIDNQLNYQFIKRISINEQTKTVWFELIVINTITNKEDWLIKDTVDFYYGRANRKIKHFLLAVIYAETFRENIYNKTIEELENGFKVNGKEFLLKDNKYAELLNGVKNGLH